MDIVERIEEYEVSSDYCSTFNKKIYLSSGDYHNDVDISEDGKCMVVASKDLGVYVSLDYGEIGNKYNPLPSVLWRGVSINSKGYIVAVGYNDYIHLSNDFGDNWEILKENSKRNWTSAKSNNEDGNFSIINRISRCCIEYIVSEGDVIEEIELDSEPEPEPEPQPEPHTRNHSQNHSQNHSHIKNHRHKTEPQTQAERHKPRHKPQSQCHI